MLDKDGVDFKYHAIFTQLGGQELAGKALQIETAIHPFVTMNPQVVKLSVGQHYLPNMVNLLVISGHTASQYGLFVVGKCPPKMDGINLNACLFYYLQNGYYRSWRTN